MSTLKTHNLQSSDSGSVNIALAPNAGMVVAGISTFNNRVLIGTNIEGHADADDLTIGSSTNTAGITIRTNTAGTGRLWFSDGTSGDTEYRGYIQYDHNNERLSLGSGGSTRLNITNTGYVQTTSELWVGGSAPVLRWRDSTHGEKATARIDGSDLYFEVANNERLRINSSGYVGVKRSTPLANLHTTNNELAIGANPTGAAAPNATYDGLVVDGEDASILNIRSSADGNISYGRVAFSDDVRSRGYIDYRHRDGAGGALEYMNFAVAGSERLRVDSSGNVIVGGTSFGASGSFGIEQNGNVRSILAAGSTGDTLLGAIYGVSNGFQINLSGSNDQLYRFHNGNQVSMQIDSSGRVTKPLTPSFAASRTGGNVGNGNTIVFNSVKFNVGGHYNNTNGRFTAPVAGRYQFSVGCMAYGGSGDFQVRIQKNGSNYFNNNGSGRGHSTFEPYGFTVLMDMAVGDYAEITVYSSMAAVIYGTGSVWNIFSGHLVS